MIRALAIVALALSGCAHQYTGRATVLEKGEGQLTISGELSLMKTGRPQGPAIGTPWIQAALGYHQGIGARLEVGARAFGLGIPGVGGELGGAGDVKFQLFRSDNREHGVDLAIGASGSYHFVIWGDQPAHVIGGTVPLLFGINMGPHQMVFALRVADYVLTSYGQKPQNNVFFGGSFGMALRKGRIQFQPEISVLYSPVRFGGEQNSDETTGFTLVSFGVSLPIDVTDVVP
jgi:hypothetical protein